MIDAYTVEPNGGRRPPLDRDYFYDIKKLSKTYTEDVLCSAYVFVYNNTGRTIDENWLNATEKASMNFGQTN